MLNLPLAGLVELAESGRLQGARRQGGRWRMDPTTLAKLIQEMGTGDQTPEAIVELRRRLDVVEQTNEELKGQIKVIDSVRELLLQHRHGGGGSSPQPGTRVLDLLPQTWPEHFKSGEQIALVDFLRVFPGVSAHSIELLASVLMFPAPSIETLVRLGEQWSKVQGATKSEEPGS